MGSATDASADAAIGWLPPRLRTNAAAPNNADLHGEPGLIGAARRT